MNEFSYSELFTAAGLLRLDADFLRQLSTQDGGLATSLRAYRDGKQQPLSGQAQSEFLLCLAPHLERFIARLFCVEPEVAELQARTRSHDVVMDFKKHFVL
ncbi:hypothetical protein, partial [Acidithiobacillus ferriphilus]